jgi:leucyl-tRNA synthetase
VEAYIAETRKVSDIDRLSTVREKTGVFTGSYAIHPLTGAAVPVWAADYVIAGYGTGVVMAVPAHDDRDYEFARKYNLPIQRVIRSRDGAPDDLPYCEKGILVNSGEFDGLDSAAAIQHCQPSCTFPARGLSQGQLPAARLVVSRSGTGAHRFDHLYLRYCALSRCPMTSCLSGCLTMWNSGPTANRR